MLILNQYCKVQDIESYSWVIRVAKACFIIVSLIAEVWVDIKYHMKMLAMKWNRK